MKNNFLTLVILFIGVAMHAQTNDLKVEPPFWWNNMVSNELQLLVYGEDVLTDQVKVSGLEGLSLTSIESTDNPNYLFLNLKVDENCNAGKAKIKLGKGLKSKSFTYEIKQRESCSKCHQGFDADDLIYLLMPDRFANGDTLNDELGMKEGIDRTDNYGRHGGDLKGVIDHLDYIEDLGVTTLWLNPVQENNQPKESYHGYAITDFYSVDARFGSNALYKELVNTSHDKGLKVIMDLVVNHCGSEHWMIKDLPAPDWINLHEEFTRSNYRGVTNVDPYASQEDHDLMKKGWFDYTMPDLNQKHPLLAKYLIQNSIWWIEYSGFDGIRMDTYSYPDKDFLDNWVNSIKTEYPEFNIVGEVWENRASTQAYWLNGVSNNYTHQMQSITDFVWKESVSKALTENGGWDTGLARIYYTLTEDRLYERPNDLLVFLDNHDVPRFMSTIGGDLDKMKMALTLLSTSRGIPQVYYGFELGLEGWNHGEVRPEFSGGWSDHTKNAFNGKGLSETEAELLNFSKTLFNWRSSKNNFFSTASLTHYVPENDVYVYFRHRGDEVVMVALNSSDKEQQLDLTRFESVIKGKSKALNVLNSQEIILSDSIKVSPMQGLILDLN